MEDYNRGYWMDSNLLGITGDDAAIWDRYVAGLEKTGIRLKECEDSLVWDRGKSGLITAEEFYSSEIDDIFPSTGIWWHHVIWRWNAPLKILCFLWLALSGRILTWDVLCKRGFSGPNMCHLCMEAAESVDHLFCHCTFTLQLWRLLGLQLDLSAVWGGGPLTHCLWEWHSSQTVHKTLPIFFIWVLWRYRNSLIFEDCKLPMNAIISRIIRLYSHYPYGVVCRMKTGLHQPPIFPCGILGTFDGAQQGGLCGGGGTLTLAHNHYFHFWMGLGSGTNTKAELVALWALLRLVRELHIDNISILGDSMTIIDWARKKHPIRINNIVGWLDRTAEIIESFQYTYFQHMHRGYNTAADRLSKRGLRIIEGYIFIDEFVEGSRISSKSTRYY